MRAFSRAQRVVSTIICWCSHAGTGMAISARNRLNSSQSSGAIYGDAIGGLYGIGALQPGYEAYRHTGLLHAAMVLRRRASFPRLIESLVPECLRNLIVAGRSRKSSAALVAD